MCNLRKRKMTLPQVRLESCTDQDLEKYLTRLNKHRIEMIEEMSALKEDDKDYTHNMADVASLKKEYDQEIDRVIRYLTAIRIKRMKK